MVIGAFRKSLKESWAMLGTRSLLKSPAIIMLAVGLALAGCAKNKLPNNADWSGPQWRDTGFAAGLHRQCRRPRLLRDRFLRADRHCPPDARQTGVVAAEIHQLPDHDRRPCRRTRHARIQHRARRTACCGSDANISSARGVPAKRMQHDLLRQGTAGRGLRRHLVLVAEPPRGDDAGGSHGLISDRTG